jgi:hypothetical protein
VIANLFRGSETPVAYVGTVNSLVANNTFIQPTRWLMRILQETVSSGGYSFLPCGNNQFINNLVYFDRSQISTSVNIGANTDAASFAFANNLWYAFNQPSQSQPTLPSPETDGVYAVNPLFVNAASGDFSVLTNSPASGKGVKLTGVRADALERCYANPPTIGAFEAKPPPVERADADGDLMPDVWEQANGFDRDDPGDAPLDADHDGLSNLGEFLAGTKPNDPLSFFSLRADPATPGSFSFRYSTLTGRTYRVESRALATIAAWSEETSVSGTGSEVEHVESPLGAKAKVFRVKLEPSP